MAKHLKDLVSTIIPTNQSWKIVLLQKWNTIIGDLKIQVKLEKIGNDFLTLGVCNSSWMQELSCLSDILLQKINQQLPEPCIKKLRFKCISNTKKKTLNLVLPVAPKSNTPPLSLIQLKALEKIKDPHLKNSLQLYLVRCQIK